MYWKSGELSAADAELPITHMFWGREVRVELEKKKAVAPAGNEGAQAAIPSAKQADVQYVFCDADDLDRSALPAGANVRILDDTRTNRRCAEAIKRELTTAAELRNAEGTEPSLYVALGVGSLTDLQDTVSTLHGSPLDPTLDDWHDHAADVLFFPVLDTT